VAPYVAESKPYFSLDVYAGYSNISMASLIDVWMVVIM